jgi:GntR family transcriptional regulator
MLCMLSMHSSLLIAHADARPMYLQLIEQVQQRIAVGDWPAGHELPSIRALAAETRVSVITIKRAYSELERAGLIVTRQGRGSFVAERAGLSLELRRQELDGQLAAAADLGRRLGLSADALAERMREVARAHEGPEAHREPPRSHEES